MTSLALSLAFFSVLAATHGFTSIHSQAFSWHISPVVPAFCGRLGQSAQATETTTEAVSIDPKEAVKLFGRLAEKYIMLDESGGNCCYSACSDCEYRLPGGGYRMADQSAARPKWIPSYVSRSINGKEHNTKWSCELYQEGETSLDQATFCKRLVQLAYAPPLGGPYVGASAATIEDTTVARRLFDVLADGKENLTKARISTRLKQLAMGEEGMTWPKFQEALKS